MEQDKISILMSSYNETVKMVHESVISLLMQDYINIEILFVVDNKDNIGVIKDLKRMAQNDDRLKIFINYKNRGLPASLNYAFSKSSGNLIARMDSDDISLVNRFSSEVEFMKKNGLDFVFASMDFMNEDGIFTHSEKLNENIISQKKMKKYLLITDIANHPTWLLKREVMDKLGGYRKFKTAEDYDFVLRAMENKFVLGKMKKRLLRYRIRNNSMSNMTTIYQIAYGHFFKKLFSKNMLCKTSSDEIKNKVRITHFQEKKFKISNKFFNKGIASINDHLLIRGIIQVGISFLLSKYARIRIIDLIRYKRIHF